MNRTVAIIAAMLLLASAGWWGWARPDLLPAGVDGEEGAATAPATAEAPQPETPPAGENAEPPEAPAPEPDTPALTPAPRDAELPPETGSALARETEAVAEAAIAAADARARAEATARAERLALEAAQTELRAALQPFLNPAGFSAAAIRDAIAALPASDGPLVMQMRGRLTGQISAILETAELASLPGPAADPAEDAAEDAGSEVDTPSPPFDPEPYIDLIERLL